MAFVSMSSDILFTTRLKQERQVTSSEVLDVTLVFVSASNMIKKVRDICRCFGPQFTM
jgi:hypothetical protein